MRAVLALSGAPILALISIILPAQGQLIGENLLQKMPAKFRMASQASHNGMTMNEFVPQGEAVDNWSEMITTQVFLGKKDVVPANFLRGIGMKWLTSCPGSKPTNIKSGKANGYPVSMFLLQCDVSPQTGKPENTLFRAIQGGDSFYLVQYSVRYRLTKESLFNAIQFLGSVDVCDSRSQEHACPDLGEQGFSQVNRF